MSTLIKITLAYIIIVYTLNTMANELVSTPITQQMLTDISKVQWQLNRVQDAGSPKPLPKESPITIMLEENGKLGGGAPVNRYFGQFELKENGVIQWQGPGLGATKMAGPPELMKLEQYYFKILHQCDRLSIKDETLIFHTQDGKLHLEYKKQ
ncbi:MAG: hypothetical protein AMJ53_16960 [Gammaproteobacteria bacterium SG8_11]|nr:MAG: hypothetical protein AMJ53_16960 [Gammaproteobacteria bacterium SG8_11]